MARQFIVSILVVLVCLSIYPENVSTADTMSSIYPTDYSDCEFPFNYRGKTYTNCTVDGDNGDVAWCSLTKDYIGQFTYCYDFFNASLECLGTYTVNGKQYSGCNVLSKSAKYKQCKTNNPDYPYIYCPDVTREAKKAFKKRRRECKKEYKAISQDHSMCFAPSYWAIQVNITEDEKQELLDIHNQYRAEPESEHMLKLAWDPELARMAQARGDMCVFDHDLAQNRISPVYNWKNGQNLVWSTEIRNSLASLIDMMLDAEKARFYYGVGCKPEGQCLHYTQAMISNLTRMGCAVTHCLYKDHIDRYLTCNYIQSQYANKYTTPWVKSSTSRCGAGRLCDCGDKICKYDANEYLDPISCECKVEKTKRSLNKRDADTTGTVNIAAPNAMSSLLKRSLNKRQADREGVVNIAAPNAISSLSKRSILYLGKHGGAGSSKSKRSIQYFKKTGGHKTE